MILWLILNKLPDVVFFIIKYKKNDTHITCVSLSILNLHFYFSAWFVSRKKKDFKCAANIGWKTVL